MDYKLETRFILGEWREVKVYAPSPPKKPRHRLKTGLERFGRPTAGTVRFHTVQFYGSRHSTKRTG